jgi:hypothetical protein
MPGQTHAPRQQATADAGTERNPIVLEDQVITIDLSHTDLTLQELQHVAADASRATTPEGEGLFANARTYTPLPTDHADYLIGRCDEDIARTNDALAWRANLAAKQEGKQQIQADKQAFGSTNAKIPVIFSAMNLFEESTAYAESMIGGIAAEIGDGGVEAVRNWLLNPLPDNLQGQITDAPANFNGAPMAGPSLMGELGMTSGDSTSSLTTAVTDLSGLAGEAMGLGEQLEASARQQAALLRGVDANEFDDELAAINSAKSAYGNLVTVTKNAVSIAAAASNPVGWFTLFATACNLAFNAFADHQAAIVRAQQRGAQWDSLLGQLDSANMMTGATQQQLRGLKEQTTAAAQRYEDGEREIRERRDARRAGLATLGANATADGAAEGSGDLTARLLVAGALIETVVMAQYVQQVITNNGLSPADINTLWRETYDHRANNACTSLRYAYTLEESGGILGAWNWTHPSEDAAFESINSMTTWASELAGAYIHELGALPQNAYDQLQAVAPSMSAY